MQEYKTPQPCDNPHADPQDAADYPDEQMYLGQRAVDRKGSHPGELIVDRFNLGDSVMQGLSGPFTVIGYYRGNVVLRVPANGCTHHAHPSELSAI